MKSHSHQDAFFQGTLEKGLGSLQGSEMGWSLMNDLINPLINKATAAPAAPVVLPAPVIPAIVKKDMTMTYAKYGAIAVGGLLTVAIIMKMLNKKRP